jgi:hypothetical protein
MGLDPLLPSNCFNEAPSGLGALDIG